MIAGHSQDFSFKALLFFIVPKVHKATDKESQVLYIFDIVVKKYNGIIDIY